MVVGPAAWVGKKDAERKRFAGEKAPVLQAGRALNHQQLAL